MQELVLYIVKSLVNNPDDVIVHTRSEDLAEVIEIQVNPEDLGRVIGKNGKIAKAIRTLVQTQITSDRRRYIVKILE